MTPTQNVEDALKLMDGCISTLPEGNKRDWQTIRAHLLSQDAEIERLTRENETMRRALETLDAIGHKRADKAESRLAAADALLRECYEWLFESLSDGPRVSEGAIDKGQYTPQFVELHDRLQARLQGAGDE